MLRNVTSKIGLGVTATALMATRAFASAIDDGVGAAGATLPQSSLTSYTSQIVDIMIYAIGFVSVIMLIIGGFRYVLSGGDSKNTTAAKDTILYAIIGVVVALLSYSIVHFVIGQIQ